MECYAVGLSRLRMLCIAGALHERVAVAVGNQRGRFSQQGREGSKEQVDVIDGNQFLVVGHDLHGAAGIREHDQLDGAAKQSA